MKEIRKNHGGKVADLRALLRTDPKFRKAWGRVDAERRKMLLDVADGKAMPDLLSDPVFKEIFDPDASGGSLSLFLSSVLGSEVTVLHSLKNEGKRHGASSKGIVLDLVAQFERGVLYCFRRTGGG